MVKVTTFSDTICQTPAVIQDQLFVKEWMKRKSYAVDCRRIRDVLAQPTDDGGTLCRIDLEGEHVIFCVDNPAVVRMFWLAWAADNLRFTTEVRRG